MKTLPADRLNLREYIRPGDHIVMSEAAGEPQTLADLLIEQRAELGHPQLFSALVRRPALSPSTPMRYGSVALGLP